MSLKRYKKRYMTLLELLIGMALTILLLTTVTYFYQEIEQLNSASEKTQKEIFQLEYVENRLGSILPKILPERSNNPPIFFLSNNLHGLLADNSPSLVFEYETGTDLDNHRAVSALGRLFLDRQNRLCLASWPDPEEWGETELPPLHLEVLMENVQRLAFKFYVAPERDRSLVTGKKKTDEALMVNASEKDKKSEGKKDDKKDDKKDNAVKQPNDIKEPAKKELVQKKDDKQPAGPTGSVPAEEETEEPVQVSDSNGVEPEPKGQWIFEWRREYQQIPSMLKVEITQMINDEEKPTVFAFPLLNCKEVIVYE